MFSKFTQPTKAVPSINSTESGILMLLKFKQFLKQFFGIFFTPFGISISSNLTHFSKHPSSILLTQGGTKINFKCFQL